MAEETSAGAIVYNKGKYLLLYRKAHDHYKEGWFFARGKIEPGEELEQTARREILEETGIRDLFFVKGFKQVVTWFYRANGQLIHKTAIYLFAETSTEEVVLTDYHNSFAWLSFDDAYARLSFPSDRQVLIEAHNFMDIAKKV